LIATELREYWHGVRNPRNLSPYRAIKALPLNKCFKHTPTIQYSQWFMRRIWITYLPTDPKERTARGRLVVDAAAADAF